MRRRLRKKLRYGEFREYGFLLVAELTPGADHDALIDRFIETVEALNLGFGGGGEPILHGFVARTGRGSATEEDREALARFLVSDPAVVRHQVGPLTDAWHGPWRDLDLPVTQTTAPNVVG